METVSALLGIGSNAGDRMQYLRSAIEELSRVKVCRVRRVSSVYETEPVGYENQEDFLNAAAEIAWSGTAGELLAEIHRIEDRNGRQRTMRWGPRTLDIDILTFGDAVITSFDLTIPHPEIQSRKFVLIPLSEICGNLVIPGTGKPVIQLADGCPDTHRVSKIAPATSIWQKAE